MNNELDARLNKSQQLWNSLKSSNSNFVKNKHFQKKRHHYAAQQNPPCIILTCADSRVPAEPIFGKDVGDLFTVRVAGNIADDVVIDSIEFATHTFDVCLIIVMGHTNCGAVIGAIKRLKENNGQISTQKGHLSTILSPIEKAIVSNNIDINSEDALKQAIQVNVRYVVDQLLAKSFIVKNAVTNKKLMLVGAEYNIESGVVIELFRIDK